MKRLNSKELQSFAESLNTISEKTKPEDININMLDMLGPLMKSGFSGGAAGLRDALRKKMIEKGGDPAEVDAYMKKQQQNKTAPEASSDAETKTEPETKTKPELETKPSSSSSDTVPAGSFNISPKGSDRRNEVEAQIKKDNAARTDDQRVEPKTAPKPKLTDQQKVRAEYDRLRYSKDPKERSQAASYGKAMAAAGAAKKDFSGYKSAAELSKPAGNIVKSGSGATLSSAPKNDLARGSTPIVVNRGTTEKTSYAYDKPVTGSMAQRLQAIRARSQSRIAAQGGTSATPAVNPTSKVAPLSVSNTQTKPAVTPNQKSSIQQKVDNVKKPVQTGDKPVVKVNPDTSEMQLKQKRSKAATDKIKSSLDMS